MSKIPSCEAILLEIQQAFGLESLQTPVKKRFASLDMRLQTHHDMNLSILRGIFDALDYAHDPRLLDDLLTSWTEMVQFHSVVENNVRTYGANDDQIAWHLLSHQFAPGLARKYAFWTLVDPVAPGMSGGDLWFVPRPSPSNPLRLRLPVQAVCEWWLDLLNCTLDGIWKGDATADNKVRNVQNWRKGMTPSGEAIEQAFNPHFRFTYAGAYEDDPTASTAVRFQSALRFVRDSKQLNASALTQEIPLIPKMLFDEALSDTPDDDVKEPFVEAIATRWQKPTTATVRRRFLLARAIQDGHCRLSKLISPSIDDPFVSDPAANKIVQIWNLFEETYRLTLEADIGCRSERESNARFADLVPDWLARGTLRSIMDIRVGTPEQFACWFSERFREIGPHSPVNNLFANGNLNEGADKQKIDVTVETGRRNLENLLIRAWDAQEDGNQGEAETTLHRIAELPEKDEFRADVLFLQGCHALNKNNTDRARKLFDAAFEECRNYSFGPLRKEVAYACLGMAMSFGAFDERAERYFRVLATSLNPSERGGSPDEIRSINDLEVLFRDVSRLAAAKFWKDIYRPYGGWERLIPPPVEDAGPLLDEFLALCASGDEAQISAWVRRKKGILSRRLREVQGDTPFMALIKLVNSVEPNEPMHPAHAGVANTLLGQVRKGLRLMAENLERKALDLADFKKQTPLMLSADQNCAPLVRILLDRGADFDAQDIVGRTALHSAAARRASDCYLMILKNGADPTKCTTDGISALVTTVKFGLPEAVQTTLEMWGDKISAAELHRLRELAQDIYDGYKEHRPLVAVHGRRLAPKPAYKMISDMLQEFTSKRCMYH